MQKLSALISLLSQADELEPAQSVSAAPPDFWTPGAIVFCSAGLFILILWLSRYGGFRALRCAPIRRHRMIGFEPVAILGIWLVLMVGIGLLIETVFSESSSSFRLALNYPATAFLETVLIVIMLILAYFTFARRLKGFGLNIRSLGSDAKLAFVYLLAVYPLILFALWSVLTVGKMISEDFSIEVHQSLSFLGENANPVFTAFVVVFAVFIVPVFEEMLFRGLLQTSLRSWVRNPWAAIILASLLFSLLHPPTHIPALFFLSCGLGYAYERSGSLFRPILMHIFFNAVSVAATFVISS